MSAAPTPVREPAPPYRGEGPFGLWHFSEDASIERFVPHVARTSSDLRPLVWAIDTRHAPMFWFPRDCPRGCVWTTSTTSAEDKERFFGGRAPARLHVVESEWLERIRGCRVFAYRLPTAPFRPHEEVGGYWVSDAAVVPVERVELDRLVERHGDAAIELRSEPSIWPFWEAVVGSTLSYSGIRLANSSHPRRS